MSRNECKVIPITRAQGGGRHRPTRTELLDQTLAAVQRHYPDCDVLIVMPREVAEDRYGPATQGAPGVIA